jgi:DnaJ-class molecular chaperone
LIKDYYQILGLPAYAKYTKIAERHYDLTDIFIDNRTKVDHSTVDFELQTEAFYLLKNPKRKVRYDRLHAIKFADKPIKHSKILKKWKLEISEEITEAEALAKELAQLTNAELTDRNAKLTPRTALLGFFRNVIGWILNLFSFLLQF